MQVKEKARRRLRPLRRFDHAYNAVLTLMPEILEEYRLEKVHHKRIRGKVYDFTRSMLALMEQFHNELLDLVKEWAPIDDLFADRRELIQAVRAGMTRKEFMEQSLPKWLAVNVPAPKHAKEKRQIACPIPPEPKTGEHLRPEEIAARWRARCLSWQAKYEQLEA